MQAFDCKLKGYKPLVQLGSTLILYRRGKLWRYCDGSLTFWMTLHQASWKDSSRLSVRLFRREPKFAVPIGNDVLLLAWQRKIYRLSFSTNSCSAIFTARQGFSDPLSICPGNGDMIAIWGDYGANDQRDDVNIYGFTRSGEVSVLYSFPKGMIRHIHNILPCSSGGYYIFTGDTEEAAGIYRADDFFTTVQPVALGEQKYRAVVGFDTSAGLLYATDAVNERNYLYLLRDSGELEQIASLNGSCIYGRTCRSGYLFSTTVEPDERKRGIGSWISYRRGEGILSWNSDVILVDNHFNVRTLASFRKDIYPMKLMQYGCVQFPAGDGREVWLYPVAVKGKDGVAIKIEDE